MLTNEESVSDIRLMEGNRFWGGLSCDKIWFCFIFQGFAFGFILADYCKDETSYIYWKGLMINWGFKMKEGDRFPHEFSLVVDAIAHQNLECGMYASS